MKTPHVAHKSLTIEEQGDAIFYTFSFEGSYDEMYSLILDIPINSFYKLPEAEYIGGRVTRSHLEQIGGTFWRATFHCQQNQHGDVTSPPNTAYGKKSASLSGGMLSVPIEAHPRYKTCWKYYLVAKEGVTAIPSWWNSATGTLLPSGAAQSYRWIASLAELNNYPGWHEIASPKKPGMTHFDVATYVVRESIRCKTQAQAGKFAANRLNKIIRPDYDFGITAGDWKCDSANIRWGGKFWLVDLSYTCSIGNWDAEVYSLG